MAAGLACYALFLLALTLVLRPLAPGWLFLLGIAAAAAQVVRRAGLTNDRTRDGCFRPLG